MALPLSILAAAEPLEGVDGATMADFSVETVGMAACLKPKGDSAMRYQRDVAAH